ncbi:hypothetical protein EU546_03010, partial [Candidatus Thorarchaeota archaeon]
MISMFSSLVLRLLGLRLTSRALPVSSTGTSKISIAYFRSDISKSYLLLIEVIGLVTRKIRELANNERKFLWSPVGSVSVVFRIDGSVPVDSLRAAIGRIGEKHPLVSSRVEMNEERVLHFVYDSEIVPQLRIVERESDDHWIRAIRDEFAIPFNQFTGPPIRFILLRSESRSDLVAYAQHAICDGTALAFLLRDILTLTASPESSLDTLEPDILLPELFSQQLEGGGLVDRIKSFFIGRMNKKWRKNPFFFDYEDFLGIHEAFVKQYEYDAVVVEMDRDKTRRLTEVCRANGVTVNTALTVAFNQAYNDIVAEELGKSEELVLPYDLRNRVKPPLGDVFGLLVGTLEVPYKYNTSNSLWENAAELHRKTQKKIEERELFTGAMDFEKIDPTLADVVVSFTLLADQVPRDSSSYEKLKSFAQDKDNLAVSLSEKFVDQFPKVINTNLGRLDYPATYGQMALSAVFFAPAGSTMIPVVMGAVGASGI